ncbi:hypothetical protein IFR05_012927 [Cadophora sp. M221]|nr:hypothetical protein IFR05_012927 [Cadophora sp. M221]
MDSTSKYWGNNYHFVTHIGAPTTDPKARKLAKQDVMQHIRRNRKNPHVLRRYGPLQCDLDIPQTFNQSHVCPSEQLDLDTDQTYLASVDGLDVASDPNSSTLPRSLSVTHGNLNETPLRGLSISRLGAGRSDPFVKFPIELNSRSRELVELIFDERSGRASPLTVAWFQIGMLDAASFHQLLSGAATYFNNLRHGDGGQANGESLAHHAYSLQLINSQMRKPGTATTDGVISSVVGFACYYHLIGDMKSWRKHLVGLKEIVQMRGGIGSLHSNKYLRIMLSCIDISGSCTMDETPNFPFPIHLVPSTLPSLPFTSLGSFYPSHIDILALNFTNNFGLIDILQDLSLESLHLQREIQQTRGNVLKDSMYICDYTNPILHRLLSHPRQENPSATAVMAEMIRLAAILYLIAIRQSFGIYPTRVASQVHKLTVLLMTYEGSGVENRMWEDHGLRLIELWVITVGGILSDEKDKAVLFAKRLHAAMRRVSVATYGDLEDILREFSWVDEIHGTLLRDFRSNLIN